ncbi:MAG: helix-turn-helix transcriptional regulator [Treponema sp.]|nr:helix-turn-helix transcriptional regulator [Treponema sp.]
MNKEVSEVIDKIRKFRQEKKISILTLSVESGVSRSHLFYIESKKTVPSLETLAKIAHAMGLKLKDFFV